MRHAARCLLMLLMTAAAPGCARGPSGAAPASEPRASPPAEVPSADSPELPAMLAQLFIVNVDGFAYDGPLAVHPAYMGMVARLQLGGVIAHYGSKDFEKIKATNRALANLTDLPLLICADIFRLAGSGGGPAAGKTACFGDGYVGGFIGKFTALGDSDFKALAAINAFVFSALGVNVMLGPTVDDSTGDGRTAERAGVVMAELSRFGVQPVLKHYPFLPSNADLHRQSPDTWVPLEYVKTRTRIFKSLQGSCGILMSTHTFDSFVDPESIATFSAKWRILLSEDTGFRGLVMTDGLLMLDNYADRSMLGRAAPELPIREGPASWALRAIFAGHDLIVLEGGISVTTGVYDVLLSLARSDTETGRALRARIGEAYDLISRYKESRKAALTREAEARKDALDLAISAMPAENTPPDFRFDPAVLSRLEPEMRRISLGEEAPASR
jgi:hypothetical protein